MSSRTFSILCFDENSSNSLSYFFIKADFDYQVSDEEFDALMEQARNGEQENTETENARTDEV